MIIFKQIWDIIKNLLRSRPGIIIFTCIICTMLYGYHGNLELLSFFIKDWSAPGVDICTRKPIISFIPWDREFISFILGGVLMAGLPALVFKLLLKEGIKDFGFARPVPGMRKQAFIFFIVLFTVMLIPFYFASHDAGMQSVYPFYKNFKSLGEFALYELTYFPFFVAIEAMFRGYLLIGLSKDNGDQNRISAVQLGTAVIVISMLSYTTWHIGKPLSETWSTPVWGLLAGAGAYLTRSLWPVLAAHYLLNVYLDAMILHNLGLAPF